MPYKIEKVDNGYKVCKIDDSKCFSNEPLTLEQAEKQLKAIGMNSHLKGMGKPQDKDLYDKIKEEYYKKYPKHSLFRSASIVKEYLKQGGKYDGKPNKMNIKQWFDQKWLSANDYLRNKIVPCGSTNTEEDYNEYPLCRPKKILEKMNNDDLKKLIDEKNNLKEKHLITEKILNTDKYNIKSTMTGTGKQEILKKLLNLKKLILVGSAKRGEDFNDLDFITETNLKDCFLLIKDIYNNANLIINGDKYIKIKINNFIVYSLKNIYICKIYIFIWKKESFQILPPKKQNYVASILMER